jgi:hypothetical protein
MLYWLYALLLSTHFVYVFHHLTYMGILRVESKGDGMGVLGGGRGGGEGHSIVPSRASHLNLPCPVVSDKFARSPTC